MRTYPNNSSACKVCGSNSCFYSAVRCCVVEICYRYKSHIVGDFNGLVTVLIIGGEVKGYIACVVSIHVYNFSERECTVYRLIGVAFVICLIAVVGKVKHIVVILVISKVRIVERGSSSLYKESYGICLGRQVVCRLFNYCHYIVSGCRCRNSFGKRAVRTV